MGNARTRATFRSLCFVTFASASSSVFWSSAPRPVVREQAPRQKSRSSFQEVERRIDEMESGPNGAGDTTANGSASGAPPPVAAPVTEAPVTELQAKENQKKLKLFVDKPLGEAEDEEKPDEEPSFEFSKAEKVLKGIQGRLLIIKGASDENHATIEEHRGKIKTQRTAFETFVKKLNDELAILRNGMKCINQGAQIIAKIPSRPSFLEIQSGAFIDRGTVLDGGCAGGEVGGAGSTAGAVDWTANGLDGKGDKLLDQEAQTQCNGRKRGISGMSRAESNAECHGRGGCDFKTMSKEEAEAAGRPACEGKECAVCNSVDNCQNDDCEMVNLSELPESIPMCKPKCLSA